MTFSIQLLMHNPVWKCYSKGLQ